VSPTHDRNKDWEEMLADTRREAEQQRLEQEKRDHRNGLRRKREAAQRELELDRHFDPEKVIRQLRRMVKAQKKDYEMATTARDPLEDLRRLTRFSQNLTPRVKNAVLSLWHRHGYLSLERLNKMVPETRWVNSGEYRKLKESWLANKRT